MAYEADNPFSLNIVGVSDLIDSSTNKASSTGDISPEGVIGDKLDVLELPMTDEELLKLRDQWEKDYAPYETKVVIPIRRANLRSYLGRTKNGTVPDDDEIVAANLQFESEETFIPAATAQDPSPFVYSDNTPEGNAISGDVQTMLEFHAQQLLLRRKIAVMVRQWSINHLSTLKPGFRAEINDIDIDNRKIQDFVFDPEGYVDVFGHFSSWLGERIYLSAEKLIELFPKHKEYITLEVGGGDKLGTEVCYTEWWTDEYCFSTFKKKVLDKHKNEFFNYPTGEMDELTQMPVPQKRNHFASPKKPYIFLSVFSLQERPHDITGLIEQNIPNQNKVNRRDQQIDDNVSQSNNGIAFSENNFNQETGKQAANALTKKGHGVVLVPQGGPIGEAIVRLDAPSFPESAFKDLDNSKQDIRNSWGTNGIASQPQKEDTTARGMILNQGRDTSRIGGGIGDIIEQSVAKSCFDWMVQLYMVFYDEKHFGAVMGSGKATEYVTLQASDIDRQLIVGVAPNSMKPKDETSKMNQATELFQMKAIGPKTLLETLDFPNPDDAAGDGVLYAIDPQAYLQMNFPDLMQKLQQFQQQQAAAQQQAQQQQLQMEAQAGNQELQQKGQAGQQQLQQGAQAHAQKIQQNEESHKQKIEHSTEMASAKLATLKKSVPK